MKANKRVSKTVFRKGMKNPRYFIIAPSEAGFDLGDTLHVVASTTSKASFGEIYSNDEFIEESRYAGPNALQWAKDYCSDKGVKRPFVI